MKKIPRNKRIKNAPRMVLQPRDKKIILSVYENRFLKRDQIERLFFGNTASCNQRLMKLYQHKYLDRLFKPVSFGSTQAAYSLDKRGADVVAQELGKDRLNIHWKKRDNRVEFLFLEHTLAVAEFRICLDLRIRRTQNIELLFWIRECKELQDKVADPEGKLKYLPVYPDAFFGIRSIGGKSFFFVEIDRATQTNRRFKKKIVAYKQYWKSNKYQEKFGFKSFRVLTATTSKQRCNNLIRETADAGGKNMFLFTNQDYITERMILRRIWDRTTSDKPINLMD